MLIILKEDTDELMISSSPILFIRALKIEYFSKTLSDREFAQAFLDFYEVPYHTEFLSPWTFITYLIQSPNFRSLSKKALFQELLFRVYLSLREMKWFFPKITFFRKKKVKAEMDRFRDNLILTGGADGYPNYP